MMPTTPPSMLALAFQWAPKVLPVFNRNGGEQEGNQLNYWSTRRRPIFMLPSSFLAE